MNAIQQIEKIRKALEQLRQELKDKGELEQVKALEDVLSNEMSILRLAAIMSPKN